MSDTVERHDQWCKHCNKYKSGLFHRIYTRGKFRYLKCDDCHQKKQAHTARNKKIIPVQGET